MGEKNLVSAIVIIQLTHQQTFEKSDTLGCVTLTLLS